MYFLHKHKWYPFGNLVDTIDNRQASKFVHTEFRFVPVHKHTDNLRLLIDNGRVYHMDSDRMFLVDFLKQRISVNFDKNEHFSEFFILLSSQREPKYGFRQEHSGPFSPAIHSPPFRHVILTHWVLVSVRLRAKQKYVHFLKVSTETRLFTVLTIGAGKSWLTVTLSSILNNSTASVVLTRIWKTLR